MTIRILIIEDDPAIANLMKMALSLQDYTFQVVSTGEKALKQVLSWQPTLLILDLGLPDMDGTEIIKAIRSWNELPIIVVSARGESLDKIQALDLGADDYVTKPFSIDELLARIRVALRRQPAITDDATFQNGPLHIDYQAQRVTINDTEVHLTPIEYKLLITLAQNLDKVLTHNFLLKEIWDTTLQSDVTSLRVFMATLRKKIEQPNLPAFIQTHVRIGYRMLHINPSQKNIQQH